MSVEPTSLRLSDVTLSRGDRPLVSGLSFEVGPGEALWLTGPNGIGKTTILLACAGLIAADGGTIDWDGGLPRTVCAYAAHAGPERGGQTLGEELSFWQAVEGDPQPLEERLTSVGLGGLAHAPVNGLSAGQRRRLALARLMGSGKPAWLLDEPLSGLDADGHSLLLDTLGRHLDSGGLALIASHQPVVIPGVSARKLVLDRVEA